MAVLPYENLFAFEFGKICGNFFKKGISFETADLMIAATALAYDLTLVTHNVKDFQNVPNLPVVDWTAR